MKKLFLALIMLIGFSINSSAQTHLNKDGSLDMRYKENRGAVSNTYINPPKNAPTYTPSRSSSSSSPSSNFPSFPKKKDGTPDRRYKENQMSGF